MDKRTTKNPSISTPDESSSLSGVTPPSRAQTPSEAGSGPAESPGKITSRREVMNERRRANAERVSDIDAVSEALLTEQQLKNAVRSGTVFSGKVSGVQILENPVTGEKDAAAVVLLNRVVKVVIPFPELFTRDPIDMSSVDTSTSAGRLSLLRRKRQFAERMNGAQVSFVLTDAFPADGGTFLAKGSRAIAMRRAAKYFFDGNAPICREGDVVNGIITAVSRHAVVTEVYGVDVVIPQYKLSLRAMDTPMDYYKIGDNLPVKVRKIVRDKDGDVTELTLDHIYCELQDSLARYYMLPDGMRVKGIITNVYKQANSGQIQVFAWLPDWELPVKVVRFDANDFGRKLSTGTLVRLQVVGHDPAGYVVCIALSEHGNSGMFTGFSRR